MRMRLRMLPVVLAAGLVVPLAGVTGAQALATYFKVLSPRVTV